MDKDKKNALLYKILDYRGLSIRQAMWVFSNLRWMKEQKILKYYCDDCFQKIFKSHFTHLGQIYEATSVNTPHILFYRFGDKKLIMKLPNYQVLSKQINEYFRRYCYGIKREN